MDKADARKLVDSALDAARRSEGKNYYDVSGDYFTFRKSAKYIVGIIVALAVYYWLRRSQPLFVTVVSREDGRRYFDQLRAGATAVIVGLVAMMLTYYFY